MNNSHTPAGWYQVDDRTDRWWDGARWTEHLHNRADGPPKGPPSPKSAQQAAQPTRNAPFPPPAPVRGASGPSAGPGGTTRIPPTSAPGSGNQGAGKSSTPWWRRGWVIGIAALLVGLVLGAASAGAADPRDSSAYQDQAEELRAARAQVKDKDAAVTKAQQETEKAEAEVESIAGDLPDREAALKKDQAALKKAQEKAARDRAALKKTQAAVAKRERAVGIAETTIANNTIPGDGTFEVGKDMKAGTYKSAGAAGSQCYSSVNGDANGNNILSNNLTSGPSTVQVNNGQFFETSGCEDWVLQP